MITKTFRTNDAYFDFIKNRQKSKKWCQNWCQQFLY